MKLRFITLAIIGLSLVYAADSLAAGDANRGKSLYTTCSACHGQNAEGMEATNAPALTGLQTWYIVRQLEHFKEGIRGSNPKDTYGTQMAPMAQLLPDKQAMEDVAAYIHSLGK